MKVFESLRVLERSLDVRMKKQNQLSANVANVDTPGYIPKTVDFEASMSSFMSSSTALTVSARGHMSADGSMRQGSDDVTIIDDMRASATLDDNAVDLDHTMAQLAENGIQYQTVAKAVQKKLALLRYVASDGVG